MGGMGAVFVSDRLVAAAPEKRLRYYKLAGHATERQFFMLLPPRKYVPAAVRAFVEKCNEGVAPDKRFVQYMMVSDGVCVTPLTGFHTDLNGFRITLLNPDDDERARTLERIGACIRAYLGA